MKTVVAKSLILGTLSTTLFLGGHQVVAQTTGTIDVTATVAGNCTLSTTTDISFGAIDAFTASAASAEGELSLACNVGASPVVSIDDGLNDNAGARRMADGVNHIGYTIVQPTGAALDNCAPGNTVWDSANKLTATSLFVSSGGAKPIKVCGYTEAAPGGGFPSGSYSDTVTVSVVF